MRLSVKRKKMRRNSSTASASFVPYPVNLDSALREPHPPSRTCALHHPWCWPFTCTRRPNACRPNHFVTLFSTTKRRWNPNRHLFRRISMVAPRFAIHTAQHTCKLAHTVVHATSLSLCPFLSYSSAFDLPGRVGSGNVVETIDLTSAKESIIGRQTQGSPLDSWRCLFIYGDRNLADEKSWDRTKPLPRLL